MTRDNENMTKEMMEAVYQESFPFWDKIPDADREYIRQNSYLVHYPKGKNIYKVGKMRKTKRLKE